MPATEHAFTSVIYQLLHEAFGEHATDIFTASPLLQYLNMKTKSASKGSKSRSAFSSVYTIYVLAEDYLEYKASKKVGEYNSDYSGARFTDLKQRTNKLPFGSALQNHHFNNRVNGEFANRFPTCEYKPVLQDQSTRHYWINEKLLTVTVGKRSFNIASVIVKIIDAYVAAKQEAFRTFMKTCEEMQAIRKAGRKAVEDFIVGLVQPHVDARVFEIVSYAILKQYYADQSIFWGWTVDKISQEYLILYKTGRTNANDGGIDFVMRPLGRFFQVTETTDVKKYLLDIDKVQRYPITFVIKSPDNIDALRDKIRERAEHLYPVKRIVERYMECVEEIINIPILMERFATVLKSGKLKAVIDEIVLQSKVEFNVEEK